MPTFIAAGLIPGTQTSPPIASILSIVSGRSEARGVFPLKFAPVTKLPEGRGAGAIVRAFMASWVFQLPQDYTGPGGQLSWKEFELSAVLQLTHNQRVQGSSPCAPTNPSALI